MRASRSRWRSSMARIGLVLAALALAASSPGSFAAAAAKAPVPGGWGTASEINAFVQKEHAELRLSGLAVVVIAHGSVTFDRSYGDAAPGGPAVTSATPFVLGSTSKQFTGLAVQQLIAQGKLSLDDTVGQRLHRLGGADSALANVTIRQLLGHTSGLTTAEGTADVFDPSPPFSSLEAETRHLLRIPQQARGTGFEYSNANYTLLGAIIVEATGLSFEDALQRLVIQPLGLESTTTNLTLARKHGLAVGHYTWLGAIDSTTPGPQWPMGAPSAYTASSAADLTQLLQAQLGTTSGIDKAVVTADRTPLSTVSKYVRYASGWYVRSFWELHNDDANFTDPKLPLIYEHEGDTTRETSYLAFVPKLGFGVVVLSNTGLGTDSGRFNDFTARLLHKIVGTTSSPREVSPLIAATPIIMVALPLIQLAALVWLVVSLARPRRRRLGRWLPRIFGALVTAVTLLVTLVVVPGQTQQPLLVRVWWGGAPDLAVSVGPSLIFAVAWVVAAITALVRTRKATGTAAEESQETLRKSDLKRPARMS